MLLEHMHKKFEIKWTKIKGRCQSERKVVTHDSKSDLPLPYVSEHTASSLSCTERTLWKNPSFHLRGKNKKKDAE